MWAFAGRTIYQSDRLLRRAPRLGLTDVCICGNSIKDGVRALATRARLSATIRAIQGDGIDVHVLWYPWPTVAAATHAGDVLGELAVEHGLRSGLLDLEENWTQFSGSGTDHHAAADALFASYRKATTVPLGVTGIPFHDVAKLGHAVRSADYVLTQGYSSTARGYTPGRIQRVAHARWRGYGKPVVAALAAYKQQGAGGMSAARAIATAVEAVRELDMPSVSELAWWSLSDLVPGTAVHAAVAALTKGLS